LGLSGGSIDADKNEELSWLSDHGGRGCLRVDLRPIGGDWPHLWDIGGMSDQVVERGMSGESTGSERACLSCLECLKGQEERIS
jgi:hypothetical protein